MEKLIENARELGLNFMKDRLEATVLALRSHLDVDYGNEKLWREVISDLPRVNACHVEDRKSVV
jgi:hypothetical protein